MRRFVRDGGLSLVFLAIFALSLIGQSIAGHAYNNQELARHGQPPTPYLEFITSSDFLVDVAENWQSEFLQFFLFILATIWSSSEDHLNPRSRATREWGRTPINSSESTSS
ncbi:hypothetical protein SRABI98_01646 [Microbacterium sp. Bi98]|uniref:DUF6766 family protein n=1 Tax=Microbacterium sp. Bi98 TaxID=2821116 RepID=UPI001D8FAE79|nr:DUF6766 family protein [Microbacterium sp. Bi98]CAH0186298.1 hypothetical protein SRABI98_01646 [Microbacterium sp. Bi98]